MLNYVDGDECTVRSRKWKMDKHKANLKDIRKKRGARLDNHHRPRPSSSTRYQSIKFHHNERAKSIDSDNDKLL